MSEIAEGKECFEPYLEWALDSGVEVLEVSLLAGYVHGNRHVRARVEGEERAFVIRRQPLRKSLGLARRPVPYDMEAEFLTLKELETTGLATPRVWGMDSEGRFLDAPVFLMEYIEGQAVSEAAKISRVGVVYRFAEAIVAMGEVKPESVPSVVARCGRPDEPLDLLAHIESFAANLGEMPGFFRNGMAFLEKHLPDGRPCPTFSNGDFNPENFIVTAQGQVAVVDWEYVGFHDPLVELMFLHVWPEDQPFLKNNALDRVYCELAGLSRSMLRWYGVYAAMTGWYHCVTENRLRYSVLHEHRVHDLLS